MHGPAVPGAAVGAKPESLPHRIYKQSHVHISFVLDGDTIPYRTLNSPYFIFLNTERSRCPLSFKCPTINLNSTLVLICHVTYLPNQPERPLIPVLYLHQVLYLALGDHVEVADAFVIGKDERLSNHLFYLLSPSVYRTPKG